MSELSGLQLTGDIFNTPQFKEEFKKVYERVINNRNDFLKGPLKGIPKRSVVDRFLLISYNTAYDMFLSVLEKLSPLSRSERDFLRAVGTEAVSILSSKIIEAKKQESAE